MELIWLFVLMLALPFGIVGLIVLALALGLWRDYGAWVERNDMHGVDGAFVEFLLRRIFDRTIQFIGWLWRDILRGGAYERQ